MYFSDIQISNYKGYRQSETLKLETGINIVVGKNNVGKTALLEALSLRFESNPYRTIETVATSSMKPKPLSSVTFTVTLTKDEIVDLMIARQGDVEFSLALPALSSDVANELELKHYDDSSAKRFGEWFFAHESFRFRVKREAIGTEGGNWYMFPDSYLAPQFERGTENDGTINHYSKFRVEPIERTFSFYGQVTASGSNNHFDDFILRLGQSLGRYIYRFQAERIPSGPCTLGTERLLAADGSNLAEVLSLLNGNLEQFTEYNRLVREVLPDVKQVGINHLAENRGEVIVWNNKKTLSRDDLAFNLEDSGSGVGQVLCILYVIVSAREPQMIILDEPQGFLHPGAVRKLIDVVLRHTKDKHQLIIATHSPTVITSADPSSITVIGQADGEARFETIDIREASTQHAYLNAVGARLADVFGYDRVLWVEGQTEELCFPLIIKELTDHPLLGTAIIRVQQTGDFNRKDAKSVVAIYERLSHLEGGLVPPAVGFIFDGEAHSATERADLVRQSRGRVHILPRRTFENYLMNAAGLAAVCNSIEGFTDRKLSTSMIKKWLSDHKHDPKYYKPLKVPARSAKTWTDTVNGARLLEDLFKELSEGRVFFEKTSHSPMLTEWILKHSTKDFAEVAALLTEVLAKPDVD